jgi:anti-sigma factor RsiW
MAYVDGDLPAERRAELETAIAHSADLASRLSVMRASVLPYGAAFERQKLPPVPPELEKRIAELVSVSAHAPVRLPLKSDWPRLVAAFFVGVVCCAAVLRWVLTPVSTVVPWVQAAADYQRLYSRETLADMAADSAMSAKIIDRLQRLDGIPVRIPDLRSAGLTFKRVQRLSFQDQPVVQMVYLPDRGEPIALCVTQDSGADETPQAKQLGDMQAVVWRSDRLSYVLLAKRSQIDLLKLADQLAKGGTPALYSLLVGAATAAAA